MTLSPALAARLDRFTDPHDRLLAEGQQLLLDVLSVADRLGDRLAQVAVIVNGDKAPDTDGYVPVGVGILEHLAEILYELSIVYDQMTDAAP